jgi:hypothetical protein
MRLIGRPLKALQVRAPHNKGSNLQKGVCGLIQGGSHRPPRRSPPYEKIVVPKTIFQRGLGSHARGFLTSACASSAARPRAHASSASSSSCGTRHTNDGKIMSYHGRALSHAVAGSTSSSSSSSSSSAAAAHASSASSSSWGTRHKTDRKVRSLVPKERSLVMHWPG